MNNKRNPHIGSSLDAFLKHEGLYEDATNYAITRIEDNQELSRDSREAKSCEMARLSAVPQKSQ